MVASIPSTQADRPGHFTPALGISALATGPNYLSGPESERLITDIADVQALLTRQELDPTCVGPTCATERAASCTASSILQTPQALGWARRGSRSPAGSTDARQGLAGRPHGATDLRIVRSKTHGLTNSQKHVTRTAPTARLQSKLDSADLRLRGQAETIHTLDAQLAMKDTAMVALRQSLQVRPCAQGRMP
jgi:hypothetical protein